MASGDAQKVWFPEMIETLRKEGYPAMSVDALILLQQFPPMGPMSYVTMMSEESAGDLTSIWL